MSGMPIWMTFILFALTVYWGTYLAVASKLPLFATPRKWLITKLDPRDNLNRKIGDPALRGFGRAFGYLLGCEWCTSAWVGAVAVKALTLYTSVPLPVMWWASACVITGSIADMLGWGNQRWRLNRALTWQAEDDFRKRGYQIPEED